MTYKGLCESIGPYFRLPNGMRKRSEVAICTTPVVGRYELDDWTKGGYSMSTVYCYGTFVVNQGYHLESDVGFVDTNLKQGPVEREEIARAEAIEFECEEKRRKERSKCKNKLWY